MAINEVNGPTAEIETPKCRQGLCLGFGKHAKVVTVHASLAEVQMGELWPYILQQHPDVLSSFEREALSILLEMLLQLFAGGSQRGQAVEGQSIQQSAFSPWYEWDRHMCVVPVS